MLVIRSLCDYKGSGDGNTSVQCDDFGRQGFAALLVQAIHNRSSKKCPWALAGAEYRPVGIRLFPTRPREILLRDSGPAKPRAEMVEQHCATLCDRMQPLFCDFDRISDGPNHSDDGPLVVGLKQD